MVAQTLRRACRETDVVARYGGEEFALILPGVRSSRAHDLLERFRREVAATAIKLANGPRAVSVTISIGVSSWPEDGSAAAEVLAGADPPLRVQGARPEVVGPPPPPRSAPAEDRASKATHPYLASPLVRPTASLGRRRLSRSPDRSKLRVFEGYPGCCSSSSHVLAAGARVRRRWR